MSLRNGSDSWKKVPLGVFITTITALLGIIGSQYAWDRGARTEREELARALGDQFKEQASIAVKAAETSFREAKERMDRIQIDQRSLRDDFVRHVEAENARWRAR